MSTMIQLPSYLA